MAQKPATPAAPPKPAELLQFLWQKEQSSRVLLYVPPEESDAENIYTMLRHAQNEKPEGAKPVPQSIADWLQANNATIRTFGSISVVGERTVFRPVTKLGAPDYFNTGNDWQNRTSAVKELFGSLSEAQWKQVASAQGLGVNSLSNDQLALWEMAVPNPFVVDLASNYNRPAPTKENSRTLTDAERRQVRLHVKLIGTVFAVRAEGGGQYPIVFNKNRTERGFNGVTFLNLRETGAYVPPQETREDGVFAYGQYLAQYEPNRPKTLPETFVTSLSSAPVALSGEGSTPITIGKLVDDISAATGLKLYAAPRFRKRPVVLQNRGSIAASTLLRALLFATHSTVRILPPAHPDEKELYVIAQDNEPAGRTIGRIADWYGEAQSKGWDSSVDNHIAEINPANLLRFDADDPAALSDPLRESYLKTVEQKVLDGQPASDVRLKVSLNQLSPELQKEINDRAKSLVDLSQKTSNNYRVRVDSLSMSCGVWFSYIVPGTGDLAGEIDSDPMGNLASWFPRSAAANESPKGRVVVVSAGTVEEAQELLKAAQQAEAREIWLQASPDIVSSAVSAAAGVPVRAVVPLLGVTEDTPESLPRDESLYGKRSPKWLVPDDPAVIAQAAERVRAMALVSGIAGIVLRDTVPPGYRGATAENEGSTVSAGEVSTRFLGGNGVALGYGLTHRRAYLEANGQDPADIVESIPIDIARQEDPAAMTAWQKWRHEQIRPLWEAVRKAAGGKPVLLEGEASFREMGNRGRVHMAIFVPWDTKAAEPPFAAAFPNSMSTYPQFGKTPGIVVRVVGNADVRTPLREFLNLLRRENKPEETVWDLSDKSVPGTSERLRVLKRPVKESATP